MSSVITEDRWLATRDALSDAASRFTELLRSVRDPDARAVGDWSIATMAAHVWVVSRFDTISAFGDDPPPELADLSELALASGVADVSKLNELSLERVKERDLSVLASLIEERCADILERSAQMSGDEAIEWLGGIQLTVAGVIGHLLSELLVHGHDIARAEGRAWAIPSEHVVLFVEEFLLAALRSAGADERFLPEDARDVGAFSVEMRLQGATPFVIAYDGERLRVEEEITRPGDVRISADPATMLLVMYERIGPVMPLLRRKLAVGGRRPWRLRRFKRVVQMP